MFLACYIIVATLLSEKAKGEEERYDSFNFYCSLATTQNFKLYIRVKVTAPYFVCYFSWRALLSFSESQDDLEDCWR